MNLEDFASDVRHSTYSTSELKPCAPLGQGGKSPEGIINNRALNKTQWSCLGSSSFAAVGKTISKIPRGMYSVDSSPIGIIFRKRFILVDDLLRFPDSLAEDILKEIEGFWSKGKPFKEYGYLHRRGYLLYGPQGGGKTCIAHLIIADIINRGGLVIQATQPSLLDEALRVFREIEPDRPIVCLFEDIDALIKNYGEAEILSVLDGENQIDKVVNLALTNFPQLLPKRIISRPRRFDRIIKVGFPSATVRRIYFQRKLNIPAAEVEEWVEVSEEWSFAACAELVISVKCLGNDFEETVARLNVLMKAKFSSEEFEGRVGFQPNGGGESSKRF